MDTTFERARSSTAAGKVDLFRAAVRSLVKTMAIDGANERDIETIKMGMLAFVDTPGEEVENIDKYCAHYHRNCKSDVYMGAVVAAVENCDNEDAAELEVLAFVTRQRLDQM